MTKVTKLQLAEMTGYTSPPTTWFEVTQERVNAFADCTGDHQFIHVDIERAKQTPFGGTIAHGMLTLSLAAGFGDEFALEVEDTLMGINYGFNKVRFINPVKVGSRIRAVATLNEVTEKPEKKQLLLTYSVTVEIEGEETPALIADWLVMLVTK